jgi:hypothetical protein
MGGNNLGMAEVWRMRAVVWMRAAVWIRTVVRGRAVDEHEGDRLRC